MLEQFFYNFCCLIFCAGPHTCKDIPRVKQYILLSHTFYILLSPFYTSHHSSLSSPRTHVPNEVEGRGSSIGFPSLLAGLHTVRYAGRRGNDRLICDHTDPVSVQSFTSVAGAKLASWPPFDHISLYLRVIFHSFSAQFPFLLLFHFLLLQFGLPDHY